MTQELPYGCWPSTISADLLTAASVRLSEPHITDTAIYWLESRPQESGRSVLLRKSGDGRVSEPLPVEVSVRSRVHEYGGASYLIAGESIYYVAAEDQRIWHCTAGARPQPLTEAGPFRYADLCFDQGRQRLIAVREDHSIAGREAVTTLVAIALQPERPQQVLAEGHDFFSNPRLSPDGSMLCWLCWDHPAMPWDHTCCYRARLATDGRLDAPELVAGENTESIFQPQWSPDGQLYLVSDRSNWWNIYRVCDSGLQPVLPLEAEFATPQWLFGMSTFGFLAADRILACATRNGTWQLLQIDLKNGDATELRLPWSDISQLQCNRGEAVFLAAGFATTSTLYRLRPAEAATGSLEQLDAIAHSSRLSIEARLLSRPQALNFASGDKSIAHGFYYPPCNPECRPPAGARPPLIVLCHGGPTAATETGLNLKIQYWTSRGFAVMDVNYRGSTGYGRHYREQLKGAWGIHDVADVCAAASHLVDAGLADADKLIIKGSSAGGYTVLAALTFADRFTLGVSLYGIGDLETLARDTHKFEARYLDSLVGPYPAARDIYLSRSPLHHAAQLNCPVIFFQGLEDKVVPPAQAEAMVNTLQNKGIAVAYVAFEKEGHGFRRADSIRRCLEGEWSFYAQVFGWQQPSGVSQVAVHNLVQRNSS